MLSNKQINKIKKDRKLVDLALEIFDCNDNPKVRLDGWVGWGMLDTERKHRLIENVRDAEFINEHGDGTGEFTCWLSMDQFSVNHCDDFRGLKSTFGISGNDIKMLRNAGIVRSTADSFDDGTFFAHFNVKATISAIIEASTDDWIDGVISNQKEIIEDAERIIDALEEK